MPADNVFTATETSSAQLILRRPNIDDAAAIWQLVRAGDLDDNSCYAYLLLCDHFADTCLVAAVNQEICGFVAAYRPPIRPNVVFVWQIGVAAAARRQGVAKRLLHALVSLPACREVRFLEATVTPSNAASRRLFQSLATDLGVPCHIEQGFAAKMLGCEDHEQEELFRIGPFADSIQESLST